MFLYFRAIVLLIDGPLGEKFYLVQKKCGRLNACPLYYQLMNCEYHMCHNKINWFVNVACGLALYVYYLPSGRVSINEIAIFRNLSRNSFPTPSFRALYKPTNNLPLELIWRYPFRGGSAMKFKSWNITHLTNTSLLGAK